MSEQSVSVSRTIAAPAATLFAIVASPAGHAAMDGSGTVQQPRPGQPTRLQLGDKFGMDMKYGMPYRIKNTVVEYEENKLIAWQHLGRHRWRFEFDETDGQTTVTETFDWSTSLLPKAIELAGYPKKHPPSMEKTLERLEQLALDGWTPPE
ncbi:MAG: dimethyladenosine transferase [Acidimicrobiales bacterium]|nr:dimethyladenosine transferase [Acidimicrobiales bacterium]